MDKRIIIIDGNSLLNRAYYAMQKPMMTKQGLYTQGVYGFLNMLAKIQKDYEHGYIAVTFDMKSPTFRHLEYAEYKAGRKKMPPELAMQLPLLKEILSAMRITMLELDGFEADDLIGTITKKAEGEGLFPLIITGDKDELQLASDKTKVIITKKGISEFEIYDKNAIIDKYGFTPAQFIDYKGLMGDQSDNIPGLPGVGEKTAQKLLLEFGSIENLVENTDQISNVKMREKVEENAQLALMSKRLATINVNVPIEIDFEEYQVQQPDYDQLIQVYVKLEFNSLLKKINRSDKAEPKTVSTNKIELEFKEKFMIKTAQELRSLEESINADKNIVLKVFSDRNHRDIPVIYGIGIMSTLGYFYIQGENTELLDEVFRILERTSPEIIGHHLVDDYYALIANGADMLNSKETIFSTAFDTAIAQYVLEPTKSNYELKTMLFEYFNEEIENEHTFLTENGQMDLFADLSEKYLEFTEKWCGSVFALQKILKEKLAAEELETVFYEIELPLIEVLASMEAYGFSVDKNELTLTSQDLTMQIEDLSQKIYELAGEQFNINSPQQLAQILFEKLELPAGKKLKTGYSTNADVLEKLKDRHPIIDLILHYRMIAKLKGTYIEGLLPLIHKDGKIHAHFQQTVTATGRISCTEPNLQNIPIRQEEGRKVRKAFVPTEGRQLIGADYSQIELRILAHMSGDPQLIEAFNHGEDIHALTASKVLGIPEDQVTTAQRSNAKAINFGVIYGMSGFGLSTELNISRKEAERYIDEYFKKYLDVKKFMDEQVASGKRDGYVKTIMDRKRVIPEITASNYMVRQLGERLAMNSPIQGSAADIIKIAMIKVYRMLRTEKLKSKLILQVHDELIIDAEQNEAGRVKALLTECMENAMALKVKLSVGLSLGNNWYELK